MPDPEYYDDGITEKKDDRYNDEVEQAFRDNIIRALSPRDMETAIIQLTALVPSLSESEAQAKIQAHQEQDDIETARIKNSQDTTETSTKKWGIINSIFDRANLSGTK